jgi:hypothetical protein
LLHILKAGLATLFLREKNAVPLRADEKTDELGQQGGLLGELVVLGKLREATQHEAP